MKQGQRLLTESEWKEIKEYLNHCKDNAFVMKKTGRSRATIGRVKKSSSFREYERIRQGNKNIIPDPIPCEPEQLSVDSLYSSSNVQTSRMVSVLLDDIANKLIELSELFKHL